MNHPTRNRCPKTGIVLFLFLIVAALAAWAPNASAESGFFSSAGCTGCHVGVATTCNGCHAHGAHSSSSKNNINITAATNKTTYAPGETVSVTITGGYRSGWIRAILYNQNGVEVSRSTGTATGGMGGGAGYPITLTGPAPATPGTYTFTAAWYGNKYDLTEVGKGPTTFGANWTPDPNNANHGQEKVSTNSFSVSGPTDTTSPTVSSTAPANGATNVNPATAVTATFSEAVANVSGTTFYLRAAGSSTNVGGTVTLNAAGTTATLQPSAALANGTAYTATITTGVRDAAGNTLAAIYTWTFTTAAAADGTAPTVNSTNPANNATGVATNTAVSATFSENILPASVTTSSFTVNGVTGTVSVSGATATFTPSAPLAYNTTYTATVTTAVTDLASNHLAANRSWSFTTSAAPDTTAPTVSSTAPVNNATAVPVSSSVTATFSEAMKASTITTANFQLRQGTTSVPGTVTLNGAGTTATFKPNSALAGSTAYTATVTTGVQDAAGNPMAANRTWSFTTAAAADTTPPTVGTVSPSNNATGVAVNASVTASFSEAIDPLTVTGATFTLKNGATAVSGAVSAGGGTATFQPNAPLANGTTYTATLTTGVKDPAGNSLASAYSWSFTTGAAADTTPPTVNGTSPSGNATGVPTAAAITATFSENLDASSVTTATFTVKDAANATVSGAVTCVGGTATFAPASLAPSTAYTATLTTGVKDTAGNAMAQEYAWSFTTAAATQVGDRDDDGVDDSEDDYPDDDRKATVREHKNGKKITVDVSENSGTYLRRTAAMTDSDPAVNQHGKPAGYEFRWGLVEYDVEGVKAGSTIRVKLTFPESIPEGSKVYQVTSGGYGELQGAAISGSTVTLSLTDGGSGDRDLVPNGVIVDPVGIASPAASAPESGGGCSVAGGGDPGDFSGAFGALMFAGLLFVLRSRGKGKAV
jgi:hypothetical protein